MYRILGLDPHVASRPVGSPLCARFAVRLLDRIDSCKFGVAAELLAKLSALQTACASAKRGTCVESGWSRPLSHPAGRRSLKGKRESGVHHYSDYSEPPVYHWRNIPSRLHVLKGASG